MLRFKLLEIEWIDYRNYLGGDYNRVLKVIICFDREIF